MLCIYFYYYNYFNNYNNNDWCPWSSHRRIIKGTGVLGKQRTSGDHPNFYTIEIS